MPQPMSRQPRKFTFGGVNLRYAPDTVLDPKWRICNNLKPLLETGLQVRPGTTLKNTGGAFAQTAVHTLGYLNDPVNSATLLYAGAGTGLYNSAGGALIVGGFSSHPLSIVEYRLTGNASPFALIGDSSQMKKITSAGVPYKLGISAPTVAESASVVAVSQTSIEGFQADTGFTYTNVSAHSIVATGPLSDSALQITTNSGVTATVDKVAQLDLSKVGPFAASDNDYINLWVNVDNPVNITQIMLIIDVDPGSVSGGVIQASAFTKNFYWTALKGSAIQTAAQAAIPSGVDQQAALDARAQAIQDAMTQASDIPQGRATAAQLAALDSLGASQTVAGQGQWTQFQFKRSSFVPVGASIANGTKTWANTQAFRIVITTAAATVAVVQLDALYLFGGVGPDSSVGTNYDWRSTWQRSATLSESNPSPIMSTTVAGTRQAITLTPQVSADVQVDTVRHYRRGGTLTGNWYFIGQQGNWASLAVTGATWAASVATLTVGANHGLLVNGGITVQSMTPSGFNGTYQITAVTATTVSYALTSNPGAFVSGGTVKFADISTDTAIASAAQLSLTNDVPVTTANSAGTTVLEQPLQFIWGPYTGSFIFGCGDPNRPGYLYWCNAASPDAWASTNNVEVSQSSDPLQNGCIWNGQPWVFSKEAFYPIFPSPIGSGQFVPLPGLAGHGLEARWGLCGNKSTPAIWFVGKDAVYETQGGPALNITDEDLWPLFHGTTVEGNAPIDWTQEDRIRLAFFDQELWFTFQDTNGKIQNWICEIAKAHRWRQATYPSGPYVVYAQPETTNVLLFGTADGNCLIQSDTAITDNTVGIAFQGRTGFYDDPDPQSLKEYGSIVLDVNAKLDIITPTAYFNDGTVLSVVGANLSGNGRAQTSVPLSDTYARSFAIDLSGTAKLSSPVLYGFEFFYRLDVVPLTHIETPASSYGLPGYTHWFQGYITLRSKTTVTLTVTSEIGTQTITIPSTGGAKVKNLVQPILNKSKLYSFALDSSSPFRVYSEDSFFQLMPWGGQLPVEVRPFSI